MSSRAAALFAGCFVAAALVDGSTPATSIGVSAAAFSIPSTTTTLSSSCSSFHASRHPQLLKSTSATSPQRCHVLYSLRQLRGGARAAAVSSSSSPPTTSTTGNNQQPDNPNSGLPLSYNASNTDAGSLSMAELFQLLQTSPSTGLTETEAQQRLQLYGKNALLAPKGKSIWVLVLEQFEDRLVQILLVVALMSGVFSFLEVRQSTGDAGASMWKSFVEPMVILAILIVNAAVGVWQSQSASDSLEALQKMQSTLATVMRDHGDLQSGRDASELVPGDILEIRVGDKVPADCRLVSLKSSSLQLDESSLTGESVTVGKLPGDEGRVSPGLPVQDQKGMLYSGTMVTSGSGLALVVQTGMATQFGKIQKGVTEAKTEQPKTPLAIKLDEFGDTLTVIIGVICFAVWVVSIPKFNDASFSSVWEGGIYYAKVAVALGVAAIPEGLPAVITLCLSLGTRRMAERNVIVRRLQSVETLGCVSVICTDKTGTLTTNEMTSVSIVLFDKDNKGKGHLEEHAIDGFSYSPLGAIAGITKHDDVQRTPHGALADIAAVSALCNDARIVGNDPKTESDTETTRQKNKKKEQQEEKTYQRVGEPTEAALCILAEKLGGMSKFGAQSSSDEQQLPPSKLASANVEGWRDAHPRHATLEFNRERKSMSVLCEFSRESNKKRGANKLAAGNRLLVKGAPNLLIERCTHIKSRDGTVVKITGELRRAIMSKVSEMASRPLRCIALAVKDCDQLNTSLQKFEQKEDGDIAKHPLLKDPSNYRTIESGLTLVGITGIKDPARPEVAASINECTEAGIRVMMITGDAKDTAVAIAKDVNIFPKDADDRDLKAYEGREFFQLPESKQLDLLKEGNIVFCRAEPADKQKLVKMLQSLHEIPAMTGDG